MKWKDVMERKPVAYPYHDPRRVGQLWMSQTNEERATDEVARRQAKEADWQAMIIRQHAERQALLEKLNSTRHDRARLAAAEEAFEHEIFEARVKASPIKPGEIPQ